MNVYCALPKAAILREPYHQIDYCHIHDIRCWGWLILSRDEVSAFCSLSRQGNFHSLPLSHTLTFVHPILSLSFSLSLSRSLSHSLSLSLILTLSFSVLSLVLSLSLSLSVFDPHFKSISLFLSLSLFLPSFSSIYLPIYLLLKRIEWRCPSCNGYRRRKWTRRHEFKSWTRLIAFHIALIPLWKVRIQLFSLRLWVNSRAD